MSAGAIWPHIAGVPWASCPDTFYIADHHQHQQVRIFFQKNDSSIPAVNNQVAQFLEHLHEVVFSTSLASRHLIYVLPWAWLILSLQLIRISNCFQIRDLIL